MPLQKRSGGRVAVPVVGLLLVLALLVFLTSCTIQEVVLYKTSNYPAVAITPSGRIGPS